MDAPDVAGPARSAQTGNAKWERYAPIAIRTETAASAVLLAKIQREIPSVARIRKSRARKTSADDGLSAGYARPADSRRAHSEQPFRYAPEAELTCA
jgi:hypothetical protein